MVYPLPSSPVPVVYHFTFLFFRSLSLSVSLFFEGGQNQRNLTSIYIFLRSPRVIVLDTFCYDDCFFYKSNNDSLASVYYPMSLPFHLINWLAVHGRSLNSERNLQPWQNLTVIPTIVP